MFTCHKGEGPMYTNIMFCIGSRYEIALDPFLLLLPAACFSTDHANRYVYINISPRANSVHASAVLSDFSAATLCGDRMPKCYSTQNIVCPRWAVALKLESPLPPLES